VVRTHRLSFRELSVSFRGPAMRRMRDDEGRPLAEGAAPPSARVGIPMVLKRCPYPGTRLHHDHPMNVSALRQVRAHWTEVRDTVRVVRRWYAARYAFAPRIADIWRLGMHLSLLPNFLVYRARDWYPDNALPGFLGALYKAIDAIVSMMPNLLTRHMVSDGIVPAQTYTAETLYEMFEDTQAFIGDAEVCGGPPALVKELFAWLCHESPDAEGSSQAAVHALVPEPERYLEFVHGQLEMYVALRLFELQLDALGARIQELSLDEAASASVRDRRALFLPAALMADLRARGRTRWFGEQLPAVFGPPGTTSGTIAPAVADTTTMPREIEVKASIDEPWHRLLDYFIAYLGDERHGLQRFAAIDSRLNDALGRDPMPDDLATGDVSPPFDLAPSHTAAALLGLCVDNRVARLRVAHRAEASDGFDAPSLRSSRVATC
jgi:hypothetical protein